MADEIRGSVKDVAAELRYCEADLEFVGEWRWRFDLSAVAWKERYLFVGMREVDRVEFGLLVPAGDIEGSAVTITESEMQSGKHENYRVIGEGRIGK